MTSASVPYTRLRPPARLVVKAGTNLLTSGGDRLDLGVMAGIVGQVATLRQRGFQVALVSSGAIAAGRHVLRHLTESRTVPLRQMLAAVGQSKLHASWDELFRWHDLVTAQTLLTRGDLAHRASYLNARNTLLSLMEIGVVPVINENDVVAVDEIRDFQFGDNDKLSALVAGMLDAELLVMLTDIDGLYSADPARDAEARLVGLVERVTPEIESMAGKSNSGRGRGGMLSKVQAAETASAAGIEVVVASGHLSTALVDIVEGKAVGTRFLARSSRLEARKRWMLAGLGNRGTIQVDAGAVHALVRQGRSLLPAGISDASGSFDRGDTVTIVGPDGQPIAYGISNYSSIDVRKIAGVRSAEIEEQLGYQFGEEVVHRNNLVLAERSSVAGAQNTGAGG